MGDVWSKGKEYHCDSCGHSWAAGERWLWWPIRLRLSFVNWWAVSSHGVEVGWDGIEQRVFRRVVRVGPLVVLFGSDTGDSRTTRREAERHAARIRRALKGER